MNFLTKKTSWSTIELGLLKVCVLAAGIFIGIRFYQDLKQCLIAFAIITILLGVWLFYKWVMKMNAED